jgi:UPF0716 protein FxsA
MLTGIVLVAVGLLALEVEVLVEVASRIGWSSVFGILVVAALAGVTVVKTQGREAPQRIRETMRRGQFPAQEIFDGLCLAFAGILLILPGFVSDAAAALLFVPAVRRFLQARLAARFRVSRPSGPRSGRPTVIDVEAREVDPEPPPGPDRTLPPGRGD